jgi:hypothetical protein
VEDWELDLDLDEGLKGSGFPTEFNVFTDYFFVWAFFFVFMK